MSKLARSLQKQAKKRGQPLKFISELRTTRCPCWSTTFQQPDSAWHATNPTAPQCNSEGYLTTPATETNGHAFVLPYDAMSRQEIQMYSHYIERLGPVQQSDHLLIAPQLPVNVKYIDWTGRRWFVYNAVPVHVGDEIVVWLALVRGE